MLKRFIPFLLLFWAGVVWADGPVTAWKNNDQGYATWASSPSGACAQLNNALHVWSAEAINNTYRCRGTNVSDGAFFSYSSALSSWPNGICASGATPDWGKPLNDQCAPPPPPPCDKPAGQSVSWTSKVGHAQTSTGPRDGGPMSLPSSSPSCGVSTAAGDLDVNKCYRTPSTGGGWDIWCDFTGKSTGVSPTPGTGGDTSSPPAGVAGTPSNVPPTKADSGGNCPAGSVQGGVDSSGTPICIGSGTNPTGASGAGAPTDARPTSKSIISGTDANGNKVTTTTETRSNGDGSSTTRKTVDTQAPDGSVTSTTNETTGNTADGKQGQPDKPDNDLCRLHPDLTICRNSSVAGSCGQISCMGDAIQCATLREAAIMECRQKQTEDDLKASSQYTLGQQAASGNDPMQSSLPSAANGSTVDVSALSANGWLGGGAGFADVSFSFQGHVITIPFSNAMPYLLALRYALMVVASIFSFRILSGAVLGA